MSDKGGGGGNKLAETGKESVMSLRGTSGSSSLISSQSSLPPIMDNNVRYIHVQPGVTIHVHNMYMQLIVCLNIMYSQINLCITVVSEPFFIIIIEYYNY